MKRTILSTLLAASLLMVASPGFSQEEGQKQELVRALNEYTIGELNRPLILKKLVVLHLSAAWWSKLSDKSQRGVHALSFVTRDINEFCNRMGWGDAASWESSGNGNKDEWQTKIEGLLDQWAPKFSYTLKPESVACDDTAFDLTMRYFTHIGGFIAKTDWKPASGRAHIVLVPSTTAKDISVSSNKNRDVFTVVAPVHIEPLEWDAKIDRGLRRVASCISL